MMNPRQEKARSWFLRIGKETAGNIHRRVDSSVISGEVLTSWNVARDCHHLWGPVMVVQTVLQNSSPTKLFYFGTVCSTNINDRDPAVSSCLACLNSYPHYYLQMGQMLESHSLYIKCNERSFSGNFRKLHKTQSDLHWLSIWSSHYF